MPDELTFAQVLRRYLTSRQLPVSEAARCWHVDRDTLHKILRGHCSVPRTKIGFWAQILELPEADILAAVNATRAHLGRAALPVSATWGRRRRSVANHAPQPSEQGAA